jgi:acyl carrier protein
MWSVPIRNKARERPWPNAGRKPNLEGVVAAEIDPEAPLFGAGLGLDSIDALELALAISKSYGFQLRSDSDENQRIFASLRALSAYIEQHKVA